MYTNLQKIPMKDFAAEIRAHLDVEHFLSQAQLLLDIQETNVEKILENMLHHLLDEDEPHGIAFNEAKKVLFTHDSGITCDGDTAAGASHFSPKLGYDDFFLKQELVDTLIWQQIIDLTIHLSASTLSVQIN
jgi:hypothetical protein